MGSTTLVIELLSLVSAALSLVVGVILIGLWAMSCMFSSRWKRISLGISAGFVAFDACFGLANWIFIIVERASIHNSLGSKSVILGPVRIIVAGFASWVVVLLAQVFLHPRTCLTRADNSLHLLLFSLFKLRKRNSTHRYKFVHQHYHPH